MDDATVVDDDPVEAKDRPNTGGGSPVYGLGMIGALVWFWQQADDGEERALAVLKAMVWPAILVYKAFEVLSDRS